MEHRRALLRNMVTSLIVEERLETTLAKAKELRRVADRMVTLGKRGSLHARRQALSYVRTQDAVKKLFAELAERFSKRPGGYTRIYKLGYRQGDAAPMAIIEYLGAPSKPSRAERRAKVEAEKKAAASAKPKKKPKQEKTAKKAKPKMEKETKASSKKVPEKKSAPRKRRGLGAVFGRRGQKVKKG